MAKKKQPTRLAPYLFLATCFQACELGGGEAWQSLPRPLMQGVLVASHANGCEVKVQIDVIAAAISSMLMAP